LALKIVDKCGELHAPNKRYSPAERKLYTARSGLFRSGFKLDYRTKSNAGKKKVKEYKEQNVNQV
jgi:hypothetical protein